MMWETSGGCRSSCRSSQWIAGQDKQREPTVNSVHALALRDAPHHLCTPHQSILVSGSRFRQREGNRILTRK